MLPITSGEITFPATRTMKSSPKFASKISSGGTRYVLSHQPSDHLLCGEPRAVVGFCAAWGSGAPLAAPRRARGWRGLQPGSWRYAHLVRPVDRVRVFHGSRPLPPAQNLRGG